MTPRQAQHEAKNAAIVDFLKAHPWISLNAVEKDLNLKTQGILYKAITGIRKITFGDLDKIAQALEKYGMKPASKPPKTPKPPLALKKSQNPH
jgi:hypothetical protein